MGEIQPVFTEWLQCSSLAGPGVAETVRRRCCAWPSRNGRASLGVSRPTPSSHPVSPARCWLFFLPSRSYHGGLEGSRLLQILCPFLTQTKSTQLPLSRDETSLHPAASTADPTHSPALGGGHSVGWSFSAARFLFLLWTWRVPRKGRWASPSRSQGPTS